ncbi:wax ester/triacylglycerol synthase family O-acyltransferase [Pseudonocardia yuanmonensis]|uniref:Diacylglycerol O-acyltransferase n=2 Tax=Pseudonocardia yuanmonensis TaxID=1095914 RepID=A0ABP8VWE4_9PSEU
MAMDRLTAQDLMSLWPDDLGWPMDIGALAVLDGARLLDADGHFRLEMAREAIAQHLPRAPRLRQVLYVPRPGLGGPLWVDAPSFELDEHVHVAALPAPAGEAQLLAAVEQLCSRRLDRSRPLWQIWFLPGLPQRRVGMYIKLHHTVADGRAGVATLGALLDLEPDAPLPPAPTWTPAPLPSNRELLQDSLERRLRAARSALRTLARPRATAARVRRAWQPAMVGILDQRAPRTSLNRRIGAHRRLAVVRTRLDLAKQIAHAHGGKVNDALLSAVAGGLRELLLSRGEPVEGVVLKAFVPVSLHHEDVGRERGNQDAMLIAPLPIGEPDAGRRLRLIARETAELKGITHSPGVNALPIGWLQRTAWRLAPHQRYMNVSITNVPGPPKPLFMAGAPLLEVVPIVPISANLTLGVGALSYAGLFTVIAVADRDACPDVEVFAHGVRASLQELLAASIPAGRSPGTPASAAHDKATVMTRPEEDGHSLRPG